MMVNYGQRLLDYMAITVSLLAAAMILLALLMPSDESEVIVDKPPLVAKPAKALPAAPPQQSSASLSAITLPPPPVPVKSLSGSKARDARALLSKPEPETGRRQPPIVPLKPVQTSPNPGRQITPLRADNAVYKPPLNSPPVEPVAPPASQQSKPQSASKTAVIGRVLLRLQEHGKGPAIDIAWPNHAAQQDHIYKSLRRCYGVVSMVMTPAPAFFRVGDKAGVAWDFDRDRYSLFLRQPTGALPRAEQHHVDQIRRHHGIYRGHLIRLFPRSVDAYLLAALAQIIGASFPRVKAIQSRYTLVAGRIVLTHITADGRHLPGEVALPTLGSRCGIQR